MAQKVQVDTKTFVRFWIVILAFLLLLFIANKALIGIIIVGLAAFLAIAMRPLAKRIDRIYKKKSHPALSGTLAFLIVLAVVVFIIWVICPVVISETSKFIQQFPQTFEETVGGWDGVNSIAANFGINDLTGKTLAAIEEFAGRIFGDVGNFIISSLGTVTNVITASLLTMVLTLLFLLEGPKTVNRFWNFLAKYKKKEYVEARRQTVSKMANVVSTYVAKQVAVALLDGCASALIVFILSLIFGFSSGLALPMGLTTMICYLIPMFGPIIGCILVALVLLISNPWAAVIFVAIYIVYCQIESNLIAPKLHGGALNLPALVILIAITIGIYAFGLLGALIAIPVAGCIKIFITEYPKLKATA